MQETETRGVLFDYGGVLAAVHSPTAGPARMAERICTVLDRAGTPMSHADVLADFEAGYRAFGGIKRAQSRMREPAELTHREFWEFTCCDWTEQAREALLAHAMPLCRELEHLLITRPARPDAADVLGDLRSRNVRTALVCNCLSGEAGRDQLREDGLLDLLDVTVFSDEAGVRKPGAALLHRAMAALGVTPEHAVMVGDRIDRDILAARRAGVAQAVLFRTPNGPGAALRGVQPDHEIDTLSDLLPLLPAGF